MAGASTVWREDAARLFVGDAGSMTCLHTDLVPQLELCLAVSGTKLMGVSGWRNTQRLMRFNAEERPRFQETRVPADRELAPHELKLLTNATISLTVSRPGDLLMFSSAGAHFATNGAAGLNAALFHGALTAAAVPRLCAAAVRDQQRQEVDAEEDDVEEDEEEARYRFHLSAADLVLDPPRDASAVSNVYQAVFGLPERGTPSSSTRPPSSSQGSAALPKSWKQRDATSLHYAERKFEQNLENMEMALEHAKLALFGDDGSFHPEELYPGEDDGPCEIHGMGKSGQSALLDI